MTRCSVIHVGGAKTASTTLQKAVFLDAPAIHHFGEGGDGVTSPDEELVIASLLNDDEALFNFGAVEDLVRRHRAEAGSRTLVFSSADVMLANRPTMVAARLRELLGRDVYVLLVVRNQFTALSSFYAGHGAWLKPAPQPYFRRFVTFHDWLRFQQLQAPSSAFAAFSYWEQIQPFIAEFGRDRMRLVTFERLVTGDEQTWRSVSELIGLEPSKAWEMFSADHQRERISVWQMRLGRLSSWMPPIFPAPDVRLAGYLAKGARFSPRWSDDAANQVRQYFGRGNAALESEFSLGLDELGYPMEG